MNKFTKGSLVNANTRNNKLHIVSMKDDDSITGRIKLKLVSHVIHDNITDTQDNCINWQEEHVRNNMSSAIGMSIKVSYSWDGIPTGHGLMDVTPDGDITDSYVDIVGSTISADIEDVEFEDGVKKCLVVEAYVDTAVHQSLGNWLKSKMFDGKGIDTSVEIVAKENNDYIVADDRSTDSVFIPKEYDYLGQAILTVEPADKYAKIIKIINERKKENMTKDEQIAKLANELKVSEKEKEEVVKENKDLKIENEKLEEEKKVSEEKLEEKKVENEKVEEELTKSNAIVSELTSYKEKIEKDSIVSSFNEKINIYDAEITNSFKDEIEDFKSEPTKEKKDKIINSLNSAYVELDAKKRLDRKNNDFGDNFLYNNKKKELNFKDSDLDSDFLK